MVGPIPGAGAAHDHDAAWQVVQAGIEDAALVHRIMSQAYREYDGTMDPPMSGTGESAAQVAEALRRGGAVLAWDGMAAVGSARYRLSRESVRIKRISVLPSWRGQGIATAMIGCIERLALNQGRSEARLSVRMSLSANVRLYERLGYQVIKLKPHPRGLDVIGTLVKQLCDDRGA